MLFEIKKILPNIRIVGIDISKYGIKNSPKTIKYLKVYDARKPLPYKDRYFDLAISFGLFHNFEILSWRNQLLNFQEFQKSYLMVESYKNDTELFNLQCWALTCNSFFNNRVEMNSKKFGYKRYFEFIFFK